jgi:FeS assembly SUF system regulator
MKLNRLTDYAVLVLWRLNQAPGKDEGKDKKGARMMAAPALADETVVPLPTVSKVLKLLSRAGLLASSRGVNGGYSLARAPEDISVADIIGAIEGPLSLTACVDDGETVCEHTSICGMSGNWDRVNRKVLAVLEGINLTEMAPKPADFLSGYAPQSSRERSAPELAI